MKNDKKKYLVRIAHTLAVHEEIEASSPEEAKEIAEDLWDRYEIDLEDGGVETVTFDVERELPNKEKSKEHER